MSNDRHVRLRVTFEIRAREQGEYVPSDLLNQQVQRMLHAALMSLTDAELTIWDEQRGRVNFGMTPRPRRTVVERLEEWAPQRAFQGVVER